MVGEAMGECGEARPDQTRLRRSYKSVLEASAVLTILSFLASALILFAMLSRNGVSFSEVVTVDDIIITGVNFAARLLWTFILTAGLLFLFLTVALGGAGLALEALRSAKSPFWLKVIVLPPLLIGPIMSGFILLLTVRAAFSGDIPALADGGADDLWIYGAMVAAGWLLMTWRLWRRLGGKGAGCGFNLDTLTGAVLIGCGALAGVAAFQEGALAAGQARHPEFLLLGPDLPASCAGARGQIVWVGTSTVVVRCDGRDVIIKGLGNATVPGPLRPRQ